MAPMNIVFLVAQIVRWGAWVMAVFLAATALAILVFGGGDYPNEPDRQEAGLITLAWAMGVVILAAAMGPLVRQISDTRRF
jgi:hypothetical protein